MKPITVGRKNTDGDMSMPQMRALVLMLDEGSVTMFGNKKWLTPSGRRVDAPVLHNLFDRSLCKVSYTNRNRAVYTAELNQVGRIVAQAVRSDVERYLREEAATREHAVRRAVLIGDITS